MQKRWCLVPTLILAAGLAARADNVKINFKIDNKTVHDYKIEPYQFSKGPDTYVYLYKHGMTGSLRSGTHDVTRMMTTDYTLEEEWPRNKAFGILGFALRDQAGNELAFISVIRANDSGQFFAFFNATKLPTIKGDEFSWDDSKRILTIKPMMGERFYK